MVVNRFVDWWTADLVVNLYGMARTNWGSQVRSRILVVILQTTSLQRIFVRPLDNTSKVHTWITFALFPRRILALCMTKSLGCNDKQGDADDKATKNVKSAAKTLPAVSPFVFASTYKMHRLWLQAACKLQCLYSISMHGIYLRYEYSLSFADDCGIHTIWDIVD